MAVELGDRVRDRISGFEGIVTGITKWITGCDQAVVKPKVGTDGKSVDSAYFDVHALEVLEKRAIALAQPAEAGPSARKPGGPSTHAPTRIPK